MPAQVVSDMVDRSDGVPPFAEEWTRARLEAGDPATGPAVPTTLHAGLTARLGTVARHAAQTVAAIGREYGHDLLAAYGVRHALLRDKAYGVLPREPRRVLHARIARVIARLHLQVAQREPQLLAWHWSGAGRGRSHAGGGPARIAVACRWSWAWRTGPPARLSRSCA